MKNKEDRKETGEVVDKMGYGLFTVRMKDGEEIRCRCKGKMYKNRIATLIGDKVLVERVEQSDVHWITYRHGK